jgi:hypothetical protein
MDMNSVGTADRKLRWHNIWKVADGRLGWKSVSGRMYLTGIQEDPDGDMMWSSMDYTKLPESSKEIPTSVWQSIPCDQLSIASFFVDYIGDGWKFVWLFKPNLPVKSR